AGARLAPARPSRARARPESPTRSAVLAARQRWRGRGSRRGKTLTRHGGERLPDPSGPVQRFWWESKPLEGLVLDTDRASVRMADSQTLISTRVKPDLRHGATRGPTPARPGRTNRTARRRSSRTTSSPRRSDSVPGRGARRDVRSGPRASA